MKNSAMSVKTTSQGSLLVVFQNDMTSWQADRQVNRGRAQVGAYYVQGGGHSPTLFAPTASLADVRVITAHRLRLVHLNGSVQAPQLALHTST